MQYFEVPIAVLEDGDELARWAAKAVAVARAKKARPKKPTQVALIESSMPRHTGFAPLPLHGGKAPAWLFGRMVRLSREIVIYLASEYGRPKCSAALRSVLVPGVRLRARLRLALERRDDDRLRRGEGRPARTSSATSASSSPAARAPRRARRRAEIAARLRAPRRATPQPLVYASRIVGEGRQRRRAGRLPALSPRVLLHAGRRLVRRAAGDERRERHGAALSLAVRRASTSFVNEPHAAVCCDARGADAEPRRARERGRTRGASAAARTRRRPSVTLEALERAAACCGCRARHALLPELDVDPQHLEKILLKTYERAPEDFEALLGIEGVGAEDAARAGARVGADLRHAGERCAIRRGSRSRTAARTASRSRSIARPTTQTIEIFNKAINRAAIDRSEKVKAFQRLAKFGRTRSRLAEALAAPSAAPPRLQRRPVPDR